MYTYYKLQKWQVCGIPPRLLCPTVATCYTGFWLYHHFSQPAPVALLVASRYALPGYGDRRVWVRGPGWLNHCVRL